MRVLGMSSLIALAMAIGGAILAATPAVAQQGDASVNSYLCTFAGKCDTASEPTPTMKAPETKGFRLAAPQTQQAPATKGFRLAAPQQAPAPETKGFRLARTPVAVASTTPVVAPVRAPRRSANLVRPRSAVAAGRVIPASVVSAGTRANLLLAFDYNSDQMTPSAEAKARTFAQALLTPELKDKRFLIEGHTDSRGKRDLNVDLSRRRAQSVADFLIAQGVESGRVEVKGVGPDEPLPGHTAAAEANRRVEAVLL